MGSHPINLIFRFLLELTALISFGMWGWKQNDGWLRFIFAFALPIILATAWGVFAVPNDPSRSGSAPIVTPGLVRLLLELAFFAFATWCLKDIGFTKMSIIFGLLVIVHYALSYNRVVWLLTR
ncbi:YrdB family protein [Flavobacteriaceae bacterium SZ-1-7]|uniref:YrdB family protein n=1 Tax=Tamlana sedimenti TaxID=3134126 RepID=UPI0031229FA0